MLNCLIKMFLLLVSGIHGPIGPNWSEIFKILLVLVRSEIPDWLVRGSLTSIIKRFYHVENEFLFKSKLTEASLCFIKIFDQKFHSV